MSAKAVVNRFFHTYGIEHDVEGCAPLFAPDAVIRADTAPAPLDFEGYAAVGRAFLAAFPDLSVEVIDQIEEGELVATRLAWSGTQTGELNGIPATGRAFRSEAIAMDRVVDGRIQERHETSDLLGMMQQLGVIPAPAA